MTCRHLKSRPGFTLIEILIVVVILGILAAIVIPQMSGATEAAREATLKDCTRYLRDQISTYKAQHLDVAPGHPSGNPSAAPTQIAFVDQMTLSTDAMGATNATATPQFKYGPYLSKMPANPLSNKATVMMIGAGVDLPDPDDTTGWIYKPDTMQIIPNTTGNDSNGVPFAQY